MSINACLPTFLGPCSSDSLLQEIKGCYYTMQTLLQLYAYKTHEKNLDHCFFNTLDLKHFNGTTLKFLFNTIE